MLSVNNLVKIYKTAGNVEVRALDNVSIDFPEKGMVFLLGRSGSGKSTLLNVIGGLDVPTSGEICVKGRSSGNFSASDFDSYRNTFIGFVFQEYNLLNEFTVEQNISIALQLQNKANDKQAVDAILESVDLAGLGKRKPNTLSGGQRQRVAIARALIKDPEIIMADEPTGALDSSTGKQILDTLKKLSENRLVIVVSHDRDFAKEYADRIIELSDGVIISDTSRAASADGERNVRFVGEDTVTVKEWEKVTEEDIKEIVSVMKKKGGETVITSGAKTMPEVKKILKIDDCESGKFTPTRPVEKKKYTEKDARFIKSRLPMRYAFKMSGAGLKVKPFRLIFTVLLSIIAFTLFGVTSTLMMYDPDYSIATAMENSHYESVALEKQYEALLQSVRIRANGSKEVTREDEVNLVGAYSAEDLAKLNENSNGLDFAGVIDFGQYAYTGLSTGNYQRQKFKIKYVSVKSDYTWYYKLNELSGFTDCGEEFMTANGFIPLAGGYPQAYDEIAISEYIFGMYKNSNKLQGYGGNYATYQDIIGENVYFGDFAFKVVGVYDVGDIPEKYAELYSTDSDLSYYDRTQLSSEFEDYIKYGFHNVGYVSEDFYEHYKYKYVNIGKDAFYGAAIDDSEITRDVPREENSNVFTERSTALYRYAMEFYDLDGNQTEFYLSDYDIILPIEEILDGVGFDMYTKVNNDSQLKTEYAEYISIYSKYKSGKENASDRAFLYRKVISEWNKIYGENNALKLPDNYYVKCTYDEESTQLDVIGVYNVIAEKTVTNGEYFISDYLYDSFNLPFPTNATSTTANTEMTSYKSQYVADAYSERYGMVFTLTDNTLEQTYFMLQDRSYGVKFAIKNSVYDTSIAMADAFSELDTAFLVAGAVFGLFAALMLFNFISVTIENKKNEIGVLRAVGARGVDVFKIFITEALIITTVCFVLSSVASVILCSVINALAAQSVISISFLNFKFINVFIIFVISVLIAFIGTIIPVLKAARRSPVESIRAI